MGDHGGSHLIPLRTNVSDFIKGSPMAPMRAKLFKAHPALLLVLLVTTWQSAGTQEGPDSILPEEALQRLSAGLRASPLGMALEAEPEHAAELGQVAALAENHAAPEEGLTVAHEDGRKPSFPGFPGDSATCKCDTTNPHSKNHCAQKGSPQYQQGCKYWKGAQCSNPGFGGSWGCHHDNEKAVKKKAKEMAVKKKAKETAVKKKAKQKAVKKKAKETAVKKKAKEKATKKKKAKETAVKRKAKAKPPKKKAKEKAVKKKKAKEKSKKSLGTPAKHKTKG